MPLTTLASLNTDLLGTTYTTKLLAVHGEPAKKAVK